MPVKWTETDAGEADAVRYAVTEAEVADVVDALDAVLPIVREVRFENPANGRRGVRVTLEDDLKEGLVSDEVQIAVADAADRLGYTNPGVQHGDVTASTTDWFTVTYYLLGDVTVERVPNAPDNYPDYQTL